MQISDPRSTFIGAFKRIHKLKFFFSSWDVLGSSIINNFLVKPFFILFKFIAMFTLIFHFELTIGFVNQRGQYF